MKQILVLIENELEQSITGDILRSGLGAEVEITLAAGAEQAIQQLQSGAVDLFIVDVERFDVAHCNLITTARKTAPDTPILVTSVGTQEEIAGYVWRLGVRDYLLKPYRPTWLLAAVRALVRKERSVGCVADQQEIYLRRLTEHLQRFQYKKCTDAAREYLDLLYQSTDNKGVIRTSVVRFAEGVAKAGIPFSRTTQWKLSGSLEHFRVRFDQQERKYETYEFIVRMLDTIFDAIEKSGLYEVDSEQKILNYIDRNIRRGVSLDEAAEYANMSSCYFSKLFKRMTGKNYITYVTDSRIEMAKRMLVDTEMPVINIAYELSYNETNYFSKAFKKKVGVTPSEYRTAHSELFRQQGAG